MKQKYQEIIERYPYMGKTLEERQSHLRLDEPCICRNSENKYIIHLSTQCKSLLAYKLSTSVFNGTRLIHIAHACHNSQCSNWRHLYWAWVYENNKDIRRHKKDPKPFVLLEEQFIKAEEYMKQSKKERQSHLRLDEPCINIDIYAKGVNPSRYCRGLLADILQTEMFYNNGVLLCHACNNRNCMNPHHHYWGTVGENNRDILDNGGNSFYQKVLNKRGKEETKRLLSQNGKTTWERHQKTPWDLKVEKYGLDGAREIQRQARYKQMKTMSGK